MQAIKRFSHAPEAAALAVLVGLSGMPACAFAHHAPFADMAGSWFGGGRLYTEDGSEPIRCRARYVVSREGLRVDQDLVCASASYRFNVNSYVVDRSGNVFGTWSETPNDLAGQIEGVVRGNRIEARILGSSFTAHLSLVTRGNTQTVAIVPQGNPDIREVAVELRRG